MQKSDRKHGIFYRNMMIIIKKASLNFEKIATDDKLARNGIVL